MIKLFLTRMDRRFFLHLFASCSAFCATTQGADTIKWQGITVDVAADHPVATQHSLEAPKNGFQRLSVSLSNRGEQPLTIDKIEVRVPISQEIPIESDLISGGSCMGQSPLLRQKITQLNAQSSSNMYQMLKLAENDYVFVGSLSWRIFMPTFALDKNAFVISSRGEGKQLKPGQTIQYETILLQHSKDWLMSLKQYGSAIAKENDIQSTKRIDFKGWGSWDYYAYIFSADDILANGNKIKQTAPTSNLVQIDAGWYATRGDYTQVRPDLEGGMKGIADKIKAEGMMPGIWIDGFRANSFSEVCKKHPEYFLHDQDGKMIVEIRRPEGPDRDRVYIDYSHPGARAHIAECIRVIKEEFGYSYFKIDFMRFGLNQEILRNKPNITHVKAHDPSITDVERMRLGLKTMKEAVGVDGYLLGCSAVFGPCIGFVDGMRTGADISPRYEAFPERSLGNLGHFYLKGNVFNVDADYLTFRAKEDEDEKVSKEHVKNGGSMTMNEAHMWADFNKLYGNCRLASDNLLTLRPDRLALVKDAFDFPSMDETVPLDFWKRAENKADGFELVISRHGADVYLGVFNWSDAPKEYSLTAFGKAEPLILAPRHSVVLKYEGKDSFEQLCQALKSR